MAEGWGAEIKFSKGFLAYKADPGALLLYLGTRVLEKINERTDSGLDYTGAPFSPYPSDTTIRTNDGQINRGEKGQWVISTIPDPRTLVTMRSKKDVPEGRRMRDNVGMSPRAPGPKTEKIYIAPSGGRSDSKKRGFQKAFPHKARANTAQQYRTFLALDPAFWLELIQGISRDMVFAFAKKARAEREQLLAERKAQVEMRRAEAAAKRAANAAKRAARKAALEAKKLGLDPG
jgi:hypothetical protein